jgi:hypothetical protein
MPQQIESDAPIVKERLQAFENPQIHVSSACATNDRLVAMKRTGGGGRQLCRTFLTASANVESVDLNRCLQTT